MIELIKCRVVFFYINVVYMGAFMLILGNIYVLHNFLHALREYLGQPQPNTAQPSDSATGVRRQSIDPFIFCCSITACGR